MFTNFTVIKKYGIPNKDRKYEKNIGEYI